MQDFKISPCLTGMPLFFSDSRKKWKFESQNRDAIVNGPHNLSASGRRCDEKLLIYLN